MRGLQTVAKAQFLMEILQGDSLGCRCSSLSLSKLLQEKLQLFASFRVEDGLARRFASEGRDRKVDPPVHMLLTQLPEVLIESTL